MGVLRLAEMRHGALVLDATAKAVVAGRCLGDVTALNVGPGARAAAAQVAELEGVVKVLVAEHALYAHQLAEPVANLLVSLAGDYAHIIAPATADAKNILPRVAAMLDVMIVTDVTAVIDAETFERPVYAGNILQTVRCLDAIKVITFRTSSFDGARAGPPAAIEEIPASANPGLSEWIEEDVATSDRPELTSARVVVSGGRGVGSQQNFVLMERLADKLGGAVGASRAAVDSGFASNAWQVGQTGKVVAPDLYVACAISGAIQHLAGMKDSKYIVAINKDPDAPIFQIADTGLVSDIFDVVPELIDKL